VTGGDVLFDTVARWHGARPWGRVLDAGTGEKSLDWLCELPTREWTAITEEGPVRDALLARVGPRRRPSDRLLAGNWSDPSLLEGERFDVVLADYLLGAVDGHAPYFQDRLFLRLKPHVGGELYVIGQEPMPERAATEGGALVLEVARLRDACILLAGHRPYREYPLHWVRRRLAQDGFLVREAQLLPIIFRDPWLLRQLDVAARKLRHLRDGALAAAMARHIDGLRARVRSSSEARTGIHIGADWVLAATVG
jgi:hypothetical protein